MVLSKQPETSQTKRDFSPGDSKVSINSFVEEVGELIRQLSDDQITEAINHICDALKRIIAQTHDDFDQCNIHLSNFRITILIL